MGWVFAGGIVAGVVGAEHGGRIWVCKGGAEDGGCEFMEGEEAGG